MSLFSALKDVFFRNYNPKEYWEERSGSYVHEYRLGERGLHDQDKMNPLLISSLEEIKPSSLLEIGCGFGRNLKLIAENFPKCKLSGTDISAGMIDNARKFLGEKAALKVMKANALEFPEKSFDAVLSSVVLVHVPKRDIKKTLSEIARVAKKRIILLEPDIGRVTLADQMIKSKHITLHNYEELFSEIPDFKLVSKTPTEHEKVSRYVFDRVS